MHRDRNGLDIPESNREIALHLQAIKLNVSSIFERLDTLESASAQQQRMFRERVVSGLILPVLGGMLLFLLTKALS